MDYGLDAGALALMQQQHQQLYQQQQQEKPAERANQEEDCFHSEGDDNFKVQPGAITETSTWHQQCCPAAVGHRLHQAHQAQTERTAVEPRAA